MKQKKIIISIILHFTKNIGWLVSVSDGEGNILCEKTNDENKIFSFLGTTNLQILRLYGDKNKQKKNDLVGYISLNFNEKPTGNKTIISEYSITIEEILKPLLLLSNEDINLD